MKYLVLGANGQLGSEFKSYFNSHKISYTAYDIEELDISNYINLRDEIDKTRPDVIINCAAYNLVDKAETDEMMAFKINTSAPSYLAILSEKLGIKLIHYSSDYVFNGDKGSQYIETDTTVPLNTYGRSKLAGENEVINIAKDYLVFRLSWVYGMGKQNFIYKINKWSQTQKLLRIVTDEISVPTSTRLVVELTLNAINKGLNGLYHLVNNGYGRRYDWASEIISNLNLDVKIEPAKYDDFNFAAQRPKFSAMSNSLITAKLKIEIPDWKLELKEYVNREFYKK